jgi:dihydrofolate reductase
MNGLLRYGFPSLGLPRRQKRHPPARLIDELRLHVVPTVAGGGLRLFEDGLPRSGWEQAGVFVLETGALALHYRRKR